MKKFYFILIFLFLFQAITNAASNNVWEKHCIKNQENKEVCSVSTKLTLTNEKQEALGSFITIDIRYFNYTEKNLNLIDEEKKTYELEEKKIKRPFMIINVPIGIDLRSGLVINIGKFAGKASFVRCTKKGCETNMLVTPEIRKLMEDSESMNIQFSFYGLQKPSIASLSLMGFRKIFAKLK